MTSRTCRRRLFAALVALASFAVAAPDGAAVGQTANSITLVWTAPGDDGTIGRAARYDLRYSPNAISGTDTLGWWNAAAIVNMTGKVPSASGALDSMVVSGLASGVRYYAVIRTADEVPNWSRYSNVVSFFAGDKTPPRQIVDLTAH
ncbi:MAG TPA: hypothetical protein VFV24_08910 [Candidatus Eisenbacteria bacterium]|nr:hypothetical protein [Candidatus Eisenbacteria bacterium]